MTDHTKLTDEQKRIAMEAYVENGARWGLSEDGIFAAVEAVLAALPKPTGGGAHNDDICVDSFAVAMKTKLAKKRGEGYRGWDDEKLCSALRLAEMLKRHLPKGDPVDVANFAMMLWHRKGFDALISVFSRQPADVVALQARIAELEAQLAEALAQVMTPVQMLLFCPACGTQHIDQPQPEKGWDNPPHRSHECQQCGHVWRPADVATMGVETIQTQGKADGSSAPAQVMTPEVRAVVDAADWVTSATAREQPDALGELYIAVDDFRAAQNKEGGE